MSRRFKLPSHKTKIVCTIGPASRSESVLRQMIKNGMSVARLNFSHGTLAEHRQDIRLIRSLSTELNRAVTILVDLPGPKIRIGRLESEPLYLKKGENLTLTTKNVLGTTRLLSVNYKDLPESVSKGSLIFLNDGFIQLRVQQVFKDEVNCKVLIGGPLLSHKGLNIQRTKINIETITSEDLNLIDAALKEEIDTFALSFVEKAEDILKAKDFAQKKGKDIKVAAKIERVEAVKNIEEILAVSEAIMIARGDLGVQVPLEDVPLIQKRIIRQANILGRPVITATQMLESMTENTRPTRAEVADVANAILDGTDAVMLSEETAVGKYPVEAVTMMAKIASSTENNWRNIRLSLDLMNHFKNKIGRKKASIEDTVSLNVMEAAHMLKPRFILTPTKTGNTPRRISRFKPDCWTLAFTSNDKTSKFLAFSYGIYPFCIKNKIDNWPKTIMKFIKDLKLIKSGERLILTEGLASSPVGGTDSLRIITVQ